MGRRSGNGGGDQSLALSEISDTIVSMSKLSYEILVDLHVLKALTARLECDGQNHNDVLRDLLGLDSLFESEEPNAAFSTVSDAIGRVAHPNQFYSRGLALPEGTHLRARYKGTEYWAQIENGNWISADGSQHDSPSAAARHITATMVNGLRFWDGKRPGDTGWRRLEVIRNLQRK
jgi:hypothetical protein